tara:strand:+ start:267 stop:989 length:723 start_codon:yes stop_codon:yes gene_type:complete
MKKIINSITSVFGYKFKKTRWLYEKNLNLIKSLNNNNINSIIDVGANNGQFAEEIFKNGFNGYVLSFEPLKIEHSNLLDKKIKMKKYNWEIAERCGLGASEKKLEINISGMRQSSSILNISEIHTSLYPKSANIDKEKISIFPLDNFYNKITNMKKNILVKIDTQGYELEILKGAKKTLDYINAIYVEVSLVELYKNQPLFDEILDYVKKAGFSVWSVDQAVGNKETGQTYQLDILFTKN